MSHSSGKVEIVGVTHDRMYLRYHRARDPRDEGQLLVFERDDDAHWLEDLIPDEETIPDSLPFLRDTF
jgi:hypothetical protein